MMKLLECFTKVVQEHPLTLFLLVTLILNSDASARQASDDDDMRKTIRYGQDLKRPGRENTNKMRPDFAIRAMGASNTMDAIKKKAGRSYEQSALLNHPNVQYIGREDVFKTISGPFIHRDKKYALSAFNRKNTYANPRGLKSTNDGKTQSTYKYGVTRKRREARNLKTKIVRV